MASTWVRFRDQAEAIIGIGVKFLLPFISVASFIPGIPAGILKVLKIIPALMAVVEEAMPEPGSGPAKKQAVLNSAEALMVFLEGQLTGGAKGNFDKLRPAIEAVIEGTIGMVNGLAPQIIADDPLLDPNHPANQP